MYQDADTLMFFNEHPGALPLYAALEDRLRAAYEFSEEKRRR